MIAKESHNDDDDNDNVEVMGANDRPSDDNDPRDADADYHDSADDQQDDDGL